MTRQSLQTLPWLGVLLLLCLSMSVNTYAGGTDQAANPLVKADHNDHAKAGASQAHKITHSKATPIEVLPKTVFAENKKAIASIGKLGLSEEKLASIEAFHASQWLFLSILGGGALCVAMVLVAYKFGYLDQMPIAYKLYTGVGILIAIMMAIGFESHLFQKKLGNQEAIMEHALTIEIEAERAGRAEQAYKNLVFVDEALAKKQANHFHQAKDTILEEVQVIGRLTSDAEVQEVSTTIVEMAEAYKKAFDHIAKDYQEVIKNRDKTAKATSLAIEHFEHAVHAAEAYHNKLIAQGASASQTADIADLIVLLERIEIGILRATREQGGYLLDHNQKHIEALSHRLGEVAASVQDANKFLSKITLPGEIMEENLAVLKEAEQDLTILREQTTKIVQYDLDIKLQTAKAEAELHAIEAAAHALAKRTQNQFHQTGKQASKVSLAMLGCALVIGLLVSFTMATSIVSPIKSMMPALSSLAEGDLTQRLDDNRKDEFGKLAKSYNAAGHQLNELISEVTEASSEVAAASTQIAASAEEIAAGASEQSQQITTVSSAVEEMSASVIEVARKSADAANSANESGRIATEGGDVVDQTITGMRSINDAVSSSASSVQELGKRGEQIGEVITVINDIADQTNLLALNAAIEAARAGEHGRGFAVVADEVRKLADRTTKATEEIAGSIQAIQNETTTAVQKMNAGTDEVTTGVAKAEQAGDSLKQIVASAQDVSAMVQSIAAAAEEQSAASEEVSRNIEQIASVTRQTSEGTNQAAAAATQLSQRAETLQQLVSQFKTNRG